MGVISRLERSLRLTTGGREAKCIDSVGGWGWRGVMGEVGFGRGVRA